MGDKTVLPDIISNGIIVGIDGIEASIEGSEFLGIMMGVSEFTGPIGETLTALVWLGAEIYTAEQQVTAIEKYVHLSRKTEFIQFLRAFFHMAPSEYLQIKAKNEQLIEQTIHFLKEHSEIKQYIFPSFRSETILHENSKVLLDKKRDFVPDSDNIPVEPNEGHLFCLPGTLKNTERLSLQEWRPAPPLLASQFPSSYNPQTSVNKLSYLCQHALGVAYLLNRTGDATLVNLGQGNDEVIASPNSSLLFLVQNGEKIYRGGNVGNLFILEGSSITGLLEGGKGSDTIILDKFHPEKSDYLLIDSFGFLCGKNSSIVLSVPLFCLSSENRIKLININQISGRRNQQDIIYPNQNTQFINGYGGKNKEHPDIFFITNISYKNPKYILGNNTLILFFSNSGIHSIEYKIPADEVGEAQVQFPAKEAIPHRFFFECSLQYIDEIIVKNNTITISVLAYENTSRKSFTITISDSASANSENNQTESVADLFTHISYFFQDIELKLLNNGQLYAQEIIANNKTMDEKISLFTALMNRLDKSFSIQLMDNKMISIGRGAHEIFYINGLLESHIFGNGGKNTYVVLPGDDTEFPLDKITLYDTSEEDINNLVEIIDTLDLREVYKKFKQHCPDAIIFPQLLLEENDLILTLSSSTYSQTSDNTCINLGSFWELQTIRLKNALLENSNWYQKLDIFLENSIAKNIVATDDKILTLADAPLIVMGDKKIIVITNQDIGKQAELIILKTTGNYSFFRNEENLILTNSFTVTDFCTLIFYQFYQIPEMQQKVLSAKLQFFDQEIFLQDYREEIEQATHFPGIIPPEATNTTSTPTLLNSTSPVATANQEMLSQPQELRRSKRQTKVKANNIEEENHILAIEDDYFKKYQIPSSKSRRYLDEKSVEQKKAKKTSLDASQKKGVSVEKNQSLYTNPYHQAVLNYPRLRKTKSLSSVSTKKSFQTPVFAKIEASNQRKFFKNPNFTDKKSSHFFSTTQSLKPQKDFRLTEKTIQPRLTHQQNASRSKKANFHPLSHVTAQADIHGTLMLLQLAARKFSGKSRVPLPAGKKTTDVIQRAEKQTERIKSKIFGHPLLERVEIRDRCGLR